jgi:hypothetical protein
MRKKTIPFGEARGKNFDRIWREEDEVYTRVPMLHARVIFFFLWQFGAPRTEKRERERVLVIPCRFVVYRWTAHPNVAGRPVPEHTHGTVRLARFSTCVRSRAFSRRRYRAKKTFTRAE